MAGRSTNPRARSPLLLIIVSLLCLSLLVYIFSLFSTPLRTDAIPIHVDYSFVASLEKFLTKSRTSPALPDDTVGTATEQDVTKLDHLIWRKETARLYEDSFSPSPSSALRVYVYEMPAMFTYDMLWLFRNTYNDTSNLTSNGSPVHRLIQQHSIDYWLWADLISPESQRLLKNVKRVHRQEDADLFYIPFFTTISFFLLETQQRKALYRVKP